MNIKTADRLVQLRKENGYSQEALAAKLGLSRQAISKWERAESSPDTDNLIALCTLYGLTMDELLNTELPAEAAGAEAQKLPKTKTQLLGKRMLKFPFPLILAILYLILGFAFHLWSTAWVLFLLLPIYYHLGGALTVRRKKARLLAMPVPEVLISIYVLCGFFGHLWNPTWIVLLLIPLYYWLVAGFYKEKEPKTAAPDAQQ